MASLTTTDAAPLVAKRSWLAERLAVRDAIAFGMLLTIGVVLPAIVAIATGVNHLPRNDDWSYRGIAITLFETGRLELDGASQTFAIGQIALTLPLLSLLGGSDAAFWVVGVASSAVAVVAGYGLARTFLSPTRSVLVVLSLLLAPGYLAYANSYMTDVPALAAQLLALWFGARALRERDIAMGWALAAVLAALFAYSIRQFALVVPVSLAIASLWRAPNLRGVTVAGLLAIGVGLLTVGTLSLGGQVGAPPVLPDGSWRMGAVLGSLSLLLLPVTVASLSSRRSEGSAMTLLAGLIALAVALVAALASQMFPGILGNLFSPRGVPSGEYIVGGRPLIFGGEAWLLVRVVALFGIVLLGDATARSIRVLIGSPGDGSLRSRITPEIVLLATFTMAIVLGLLLYAAGFSVYDRYLWPALVPFGILLLAPASVPADVRSRRTVDAGPRPLGAAVALTMMAFVAVVASAYALNSFAFDAARWAAGVRLTQLGYHAEEVDAGYEWLGTFAPGAARINDRQIRELDPLVWYGNIWPEFERCAIVAGTDEAIPGFRSLDVESQTYRQFLVAGPEVRLSLFGSESPDCVPGGSS